MSAWTDDQREAVRDFLGSVQPSNPAALISNIEDFMPANWRAAFEKMFARLSATVPIVGTVGDVAPATGKRRKR